MKLQLVYWWFKFLMIPWSTPRKFNMEPDNGGFQSNLLFQGLILRFHFKFRGVLSVWICLKCLETIKKTSPNCGFSWWFTMVESVKALTNPTFWNMRDMSTLSFGLAFILIAPPFHSLTMPKESWSISKEHDVRETFHLSNFHEFHCLLFKSSLNSGNHANHWW